MKGKNQKPKTVLLHFYTGAEWKFKIYENFDDVLRAFNIIKKRYSRAYFVYNNGDGINKRYEHPEIQS